eukprot:CAMPEP_0184856638 /NCGR_PEP_ID=MMETSP0580-20130426/1816_1 /TAXON_ID=1118495 /ORGANISM="Dactyliosolen fragilissimus" /LENGTH=61 /DNA_ID=CAMNT_0027351775 /DNA_START=260 /DNA_END=445 /DNA_ORIENTATION=-
MTINGNGNAFLYRKWETTGPIKIPMDYDNPLDCSAVCSRECRELAFHGQVDYFADGNSFVS